MNLKYFIPVMLSGLTLAVSCSPGEAATPTPSPSPTIEATDTPPSSEGKLRADIEGFMLRLRLSEAQKAKAREKYPEPEDLWRALRAEVAKRKEASQGGQDRLVG